jgi:hypothetical protein
MRRTEEIPMRSLWVSLQKKKSAREVIALLAPIAIAVAGGIWAIFTYLFPADKPITALSPPTVSAGSGGVAAGRDISRSTINIGQPPASTPGAPQR